MSSYKALFVGEPKVKKTFWRSREHAAKSIVQDGLSVIAVYETEDGKNFYDKSAEVAKLITVGPDVGANVAAFVNRVTAAVGKTGG